MSFVSTDRLSAGYNNRIVLDDVCINAQAGQIMTLVGPNGAGKSTLLKTLAGFLAPNGGCVYLDGENLEEIELKDRASKLSVMFTEKKVSEYTSCYDIVSVGRYPYTGVMGRLNAKDKEIIEKTMKLVSAWELKDCEFSKISDGQKQRVLLARAFVQEPKVLILDEPTSYLDIGYKIEFMSILKDMAKSMNMCVIMSLHELELANAVSDIVVSVSLDGKIEKIGSPDEVLSEEYIAKLFNIKNGKYKLDKNSLIIENSVKTNNEIKVQNKSGRYGNTKFIMVQGTMSSVGKSLVTAGLCRIFMQDGYRVAPFKSQNMALNSYITEDGFEMGRAQVMQAEACGVKPDVHMNPILLKPTDDCGSQVIVNGKVKCNMKAREYFEYKKQLIPDIEKALEYLSEQADIIVIEGAGSPAEVNLKANDIVNMGMAEMADSPVVLVGDIDRGGVFAQLLGTMQLLDENEKDRVKGLIVNKFRGDKTILDSGIDILEEKSGVPVVGVLPYMDINLEDEDSLTERFNKNEKGLIDIVVIKLPHISNFTDFDTFEQLEEVSVRYVTTPSQIGTPDLLIIPGTKNTIGDMKWLRETGMEIEIKKCITKDVPVFGICGGYQMLGKHISDPDCVEVGTEIDGLGVMNTKTVMGKEKLTEQVEGHICNSTGIFKNLEGLKYKGYEIHMGKTEIAEQGRALEFTQGMSGICEENVFGTYVHGFFDEKEITVNVIKALSDKKNIAINEDRVLNYSDFKQKEYDRLASVMRQHLDMPAIYSILGVERT